MKLAVATALVVATVALPSLANSGGKTSSSGKNGPTATCAQCHIGAIAPELTIEGIGGTELTAGEAVIFTVKVKSNEPSTAGRFAGFNAATDSAGTFVAATGTRASSGEVTHSSKKALVNGEATFELNLTDLQPGDHTLYVAVNDANGNGTDRAGDNTAATTVAFTVAGGEGEGEGEGPAEEGGCGGSGASSAAGLLAAFGLTLRRRRR